MSIASHRASKLICISQMCSLEKNVPTVLANELTGILGIEKVEDPRVYLGVLAIWGRSKKCKLAYVKGQLLGKIQGYQLLGERC